MASGRDEGKAPLGQAVPLGPSRWQQRRCDVAAGGYTLKGSGGAGGSVASRRAGLIIPVQQYHRRSDCGRVYAHRVHATVTKAWPVAPLIGSSMRCVFRDSRMRTHADGQAFDLFFLLVGVFPASTTARCGHTCGQKRSRVPRPSSLSSVVVESGAVRILICSGTHAAWPQRPCETDCSPCSTHKSI